jgi:hypothetical protein
MTRIAPSLYGVNYPGELTVYRRNIVDEDEKPMRTQNAGYLGHEDGGPFKVVGRDLPGREVPRLEPPER